MNAMSPGGSAIVVRRAQLADADAIHATFLGPKAIAGTLQIPYPSLDAWRKRLAEIPPDDYMLVAAVGGAVVGNCGLHNASKSPRRRHVGNIGLAVRDDHHGRGVGSALMSAALELADGWLNMQRIELWVYVDNAAALALYRKFGFGIEGTCRAYAFRDGRYVDAYMMSRLHPALAIDERMPPADAAGKD
jgi:L-phenylalanine/L-methionine N-acetyltransferase